MATTNDKFLNYNGLVKLIGLIKNAISFKTNVFVKSIDGYGKKAAPASTSGVNDTKNKLEGDYTTGKLDGSGLDVTSNKFTYIDTTYGPAIAGSKAGLMSAADKTKLDGITDTDENVIQSRNTGSTALPVILANAADPNGASAHVNYDTDLKYTPSSDTLVIKTASSTQSGVSITPTTITVGTTGANATMTATAYSGKATQTEDDLLSTDSGKGGSMVGYGSAIGGRDTAASDVKTAIDQLNTDVSALGSSSNLVKSVDNAKQISNQDVVEAYDVNVNRNTARTGKYTKADGTTDNTYTYYETTYGLATPTSTNGNLMTTARAGLMSGPDKDKLDSMTSGGEPNVIEVVKLNDTPLTIVNKAVNVKVKVNDTLLPVDADQAVNITLKAGDIKLTDGINSNEYTTNNTVQYVLNSINNKVNSISSAGLKREIVTALPTTNIKTDTIYMILASNDTNNSGDPSTSGSSTPYSSNNNSYNEYMYINSAWERIGSTEVNLDIDPITNDEIDTAWSTTAAAS